MPCRAEFQPQNISNMVWAMATLKSVPDADFLLAVEAHAMERLQEYSAQVHAQLLAQYRTGHPMLVSVVCNIAFPSPDMCFGPAVGRE